MVIFTVHGGRKLDGCVCVHVEDVNLVRERVWIATEVTRALKLKLYIIPRSADPRHSGGHLEDENTRGDSQTVFVSSLGIQRRKAISFSKNQMWCGQATPIVSVLRRKCLDRISAGRDEPPSPLFSIHTSRSRSFLQDFPWFAFGGDVRAYPGITVETWTQYKVHATRRVLRANEDESRLLLFP